MLELHLSELTVLDLNIIFHINDIDLHKNHGELL